MSQEEIMKYAPYIGIGVFLLLAIIIVPVVIKSTRKKRKAANDFFPELAQKTGLTVNHDRLTGNYKGYDVELQYSMGTNVMSGIKMFTSGNTNAYGQNTMYPRLHVRLNSSSALPGVALYESLGLLMHTSEVVQGAFTGKEPAFPKQNVDSSPLKKGLDVYANDEFKIKIE